MDKAPGGPGEQVYRLLRKRYRVELGEFIAPRLRGRNLYEYIVGVVLSQNTSDRNAIRAYTALRKLCGGEITPEKILGLPPERIMEAIRPAGMHAQRTRNIVALARALRGRLEELAEEIRGMGVEEARKLLMELPGIGPKTADVVLLMYFGKPTFPVDTHIARITRRLGFVDKKSYEAIRGWWMRELRPEHYLEAHLLLITHGRRICRARGPRCGDCPLRKICRYASLAEAGEQVSQRPP